MIRSRRRTLLLIAGIALAALVVGLLAGTQIHSTADAASRASEPEASAITVPVELRLLETQVVTRGDVAFAGATEIELEVGELATDPVVTGQVPERGDELDEGEPLLEVVGRPVLALEGELPMYRSLRPGVSGPDVTQLKETLRRLNLYPGADDDRYTADTGRAVAQLFQRAGYDPPAAGEDAAAELAAARDFVDAAEDQLDAAKDALAAAGAGPSESERIAAQHRVDVAERQLDDARATGDRGAIADAEVELAMAKADQDALLDPPDISAERAARDAAQLELRRARDALQDAQQAAGTPLPASEVYYLPSLPRRVDDVQVGRGDVAEGAVMSVSGAELEITAEVGDSDRQLLDEEMEVILDLPTGEATGTITELRAAEGEGASGYEVVITPEELTTEQVDEVRSSNVRVTIPVGSTEGEVLAVPLAALTAGPGGESRVEVQRDGQTELVEVTVGLVAEGYAEVTPDGSLDAGDLVVVGESALDGEPGEDGAGEDGADEQETADEQ
jgi:peptidoglycan hydrolase-like protein with peptidoglycan-binding domain